MINSNFANRPINIFEESRLLRMAKSGDTNGFVKLYDAYGERVYRYIHFLVPNDRVAEGLTFQVFFIAWEQLNHHRLFSPSLILWLYSISQAQVIAFYKTHKKAAASDNDSILTVRHGENWEDFQALRDGLKLLVTEQQQVLVLKFIAGLSNKNIARVMKRREADIRVLQMQAVQVLAGHLKKTEVIINTKSFQRIFEDCLKRLSNGKSTLEECAARYSENDARLIKPTLEIIVLLNLGRNIKPSSKFNVYTHDALIQYLRSHPHPSQFVMSAFQRTALTFAMLIAALLVTGTVHAQSALPGETFYTWKLTSEQAWRALSSDPLATDLIISERRLSEWIAVSDEPTLSTSARIHYLQAISKFKSVGDSDTMTRVVPELQSQQQTLNDAGLPVTQLNDYLVAAVGSIPAGETAQVLPTPSTFVTPTLTEVLPAVVEVLPTAVEVPPTSTGVPPTAVEVLPTTTDVPPTATEVPPTVTEVPPTDTEVLPTATEVPPLATEVPPTATLAPPVATDEIQ